MLLKFGADVLFFAPLPSMPCILANISLADVCFVPEIRLLNCPGVNTVSPLCNCATTSFNSVGFPVSPSVPVPLGGGRGTFPEAPDGGPVTTGRGVAAGVAAGVVVGREVAAGVTAGVAAGVVVGRGVAAGGGGTFPEAVLGVLVGGAGTFPEAPELRGVALVFPLPPVAVVIFFTSSINASNALLVVLIASGAA